MKKQTMLMLLFAISLTFLYSNKAECKEVTFENHIGIIKDSYPSKIGISVTTEGYLAIIEPASIRYAGYVDKKGLPVYVCEYSKKTVEIPEDVETIFIVKFSPGARGVRLQKPFQDSYRVYQVGSQLYAE